MSPENLALAMSTDKGHRLWISAALHVFLCAGLVACEGGGEPSGFVGSFDHGVQSGDPLSDRVIIWSCSCLISLLYELLSAHHHTCLQTHTLSSYLELKIMLGRTRVTPRRRDTEVIPVQWRVSSSAESHLDGGPFERTGVFQASHTRDWTVRSLPE